MEVEGRNEIEAWIFARLAHQGHEHLWSSHPKSGRENECFPSSADASEIQTVWETPYGIFHVTMRSKNPKSHISGASDLQESGDEILEILLVPNLWVSSSLSSAVTLRVEQKIANNTQKFLREAWIQTSFNYSQDLMGLEKAQAVKISDNLGNFPLNNSEAVDIALFG